MSGRLYSSEDQARILQNPNVQKVTDQTLTYSPDFKVKAVRENTEGRPPHLIFLEAGFDLDLIGRETPKHCLKVWRRIFAQRGEQGLRDDRRGKHHAGRAETKNLTAEEKLRRAEARIRYLELENEFLKKLDAIERAWLAKHRRSTR